MPFFSPCFLCYISQALEYDTPANLVLNESSVFHSMVQSTGPQSAKHLIQVGFTVYECSWIYLVGGGEARQAADAQRIVLQSAKHLIQVGFRDYTTLVLRGRWCVT